MLPRRKLSACAGAKCVKLGKKLGAAIAEQKAAAAASAAEGMVVESTLFVSTDLKLAALDGKAWSVKGDKVIKLAPPAEYKKKKLEAPSKIGFSIVGNLGIATWTNCAGPCEYSVATDTAGKNKGKWFPAGFYVPLDDKRIVVVPHDADSQITVLERASGKQLHTVMLDDGVVEGPAAAVKVDADNLALVWNIGDVWTLANVALPADKAASVTKKTIPVCQ